ncbi:MAG: hypothetical protein NC341_05220 [Blautia sp.]|nr:hypothetical protein [Blautia sp.]MCM1199652.1 hypothetical protein [Bacteroides fragilis]
MAISLSGLTSGLGDIYSSLLSSGFSSSAGGGLNGLANSTLLSDYASIKNGSYGRMLKAYYTKQTKAMEEEESTSSTKKAGKDSTASSAAKAAQKSASALNSLEYTEENRDKIYDDVSSFVKDYNSMIKSASNSSVGAVSNQANTMNNTTYSNYKLLAKAGITMNADRTLSINEKTFKKADMSTLKTLFKGSNSFADQVSNRASQIYRYANNGNSSLYNSQGARTSLDTSSIMNGIV